MHILGLDPSLTGFGWCVLSYEDHQAPSILDSGVFKTSKSDGPMPWRYRYLREKVREVLTDYPDIEFVGIEHPPYNASYGLGLYALYMQVWESLVDYRKSFVYFLPSQLKAYARDYLDESGRMSKQDMKDLFTDLFEWSGRLNNNIADAGIAGHMAARFALFLAGAIEEDDLNGYEQRLFLKNTTARKTGKERKEGIFYHEGETSDSKCIRYAESHYDSLYPDSDHSPEDAYTYGYLGLDISEDG